MSLETSVIPMSHHFEAFGAYRVHDLRSLGGISDLQLLLEEDRRLLVRRPDDALHEEGVRRRRRRMKERQEIDRLRGG